MENTIDIIKSKGGEPFKIFGYQRSDGSVVDLTVRCLPQDGYKTLTEASVRMLEDNGRLLDDPLYDQASAAIMASLKKTLTGPEEGTADEGAQKAGRTSHEILVTVGDNLALLNDDPETVVLFRTEILSTREMVPPLKVVKPRDELSATKKRLNALLPIGRFCFRLNLYKGKFEYVE